MSGDIEKARAVIRSAKAKAASVRGNSPATNERREFFWNIVCELESAIRLSNGSVKSRSMHWKSILSALTDDAMKRLNGGTG